MAKKYEKMAWKAIRRGRLSQAQRAMGKCIASGGADLDLCTAYEGLILAAGSRPQGYRATQFVDRRGVNGLTPSQYKHLLSVPSAASRAARVALRYPHEEPGMLDKLVYIAQTVDGVQSAVKNAVAAAATFGVTVKAAGAPALAEGQIWEDCDPRKGGRRVTVVGFEGDRARVLNASTGRSTLVKQVEFKHGTDKPAKTGYRYVEGP